MQIKELLSSGGFITKERTTAKRVRVANLGGQSTYT